MLWIRMTLADDGWGSNISYELLAIIVAIIVALAAMSALGHERTLRRKKSCPLYPRKRTCAVQLGMSAKGQKRTFTRSAHPR
jgi:hypothetical protein